jgi:diaminohydroxyphosphoribosylaminopyrimidine deaminase/5-amino-6-(5-phosphoribosylamino)uracil reductase
VRLPGLEDREPVRIVLDSQLRMPASARLAAISAAQPTWVLTTRSPEEASFAPRVEVIAVPPDRTGRIDLGPALELLATRGVTRIFCEGGPTLAEALAAQDLLDEVVLLTGAEPLGEPGLPAIGPALAERMREDFRLVGVETAGADTIEIFERLA